MARTREDMLAELQANPRVRALVIGGGINGISVFRELALQGVDVLLVDRGDFCGACSSAPSRMIHGGLRYLENGEINLVRESLHERDALLRNAPHLVRPLPTTVPIQHRFSGLLNGAFGVLGRRSAPAERGALAVKMGLTFYDHLARNRRTMPRHVFRGRAETARLWPDLPPSVRFSATYYDAWITYPERLGVELVCDGLDAHPRALAINHLEASRRDGAQVVLTDAQTGAAVAVTADVILNATGAWVDETNAALAEGSAPEPLVGGTKGSHLILDHPELLRALNGHMLYFENVDGRVCIVFPYLGKVLLGSTDIRVERPGRVRCEDEEVAYILKSLSYVFPGIPVAPEQIVYRYSGVRPLPGSDASFTGRISRDHFVERIAGTPPTLCLVGGKWTTFRAFGAKAADQALAILGEAALLRHRDTPDRRRSRLPDRCGRAGGADLGPLRPIWRAPSARLPCGLPLRHERRPGSGILPRGAGRRRGGDRIYPERVSLPRPPRTRAHAGRHSAAADWAGDHRGADFRCDRRNRGSPCRRARLVGDEGARRGARLPEPARRRSRVNRRRPRRTRPEQDTEPRMRMSPKARMNRLFTGGRCLDVAIDHGVCNEPSFMAGLEDIGGVVDQLVAAGPDAIQMNYGQADLLQFRPEKAKPALVMRIDMGNPYNDSRHRVMWSELQNRDDPIIGALEMDAACVVVNLFMLPDEPELFRQCVANIAATRAACARYGMPLMIEPLVMLPNEVRGGYQVDGDADKIVTLVRLAAEMGADIIKADPTTNAEDFHRVVEAARRAGPGARGRQGGSALSPQQVRGVAGAGRERPRLRPQHLPAREPEAGGRRPDGDDPPRCLGRRSLADLPEWLSLACCSASTPATPSSRRCCSTAPAASLRRASATAPRWLRRLAMSSATWRSSGATPPR